MLKNFVVIGLFSLLIVGCGDSVSNPISGQPARASAAVSDPIIEILGDGVDESLEVTAPAVESQFQLSFSGSSNIGLSSFSKQPASQITALLQPNSATATGLRVNILNKSTPSASAFPFLDLQFGLGNSQRLTSGTRLSATSNSAGPRAQLVVGENSQPPRLKLFASQSGDITVLEVNPGAGNTGFVRLRFENVVMVPRVGPGNTATGSFTVSGEASFRF